MYKISPLFIILLIIYPKMLKTPIFIDIFVHYSPKNVENFDFYW